MDSRLVHNIYATGELRARLQCTGWMECWIASASALPASSWPAAFRQSDIGGNLYLVYDMHYRVPFSLYLIESPKNSDHYEKSFVAVVPSTEGRKSMLKLAERMVMSYCSGVKHPMTQKKRGGNHGVSTITEIWYLIQTFSFCL